MRAGSRPASASSLALTALAAALAVAGCGGGSAGQEGTQSGSGSGATAEAAALVPIVKRAEAGGYDILPCQSKAMAKTGGECQGDVAVGSDSAWLTMSLYGAGTPGEIVPAPGTEQKYGVYRGGFNLLEVQSLASPKAVGERIEGGFDTAKEKRLLAQKKAAYAVIDNRVWVTTGTPADPPVEEEAFLELIGAFEGCAPGCHFAKTSFGP